LQDYDWPGNIRELRNVIEGATIVARGNALQFDLPISMIAPPSTPTVLEINDTAQTEFLTEPEIQRRERANLWIILQKTGWKIKGADGAAELLGIKPTTMISRIKVMGLTRRDAWSRERSERSRCNPELHYMFTLANDKSVRSRSNDGLREAQQFGHFSRLLQGR
jgi:DNA-binding NtrC family response regulator